ncbi:hypothetical protein HZ326_30128, partial [Fusarium oxysporum f. sp. albedinis]
MYVSKLSTIAAVLILARIICKASWIGAVYMLERFLYSLPPRGTSLLVASSTVVVGEARPMDINTVDLS